MNYIKQHISLSDGKSNNCFLSPQATAFSFHDNHGTNTVLSNNKQTAERRSGTEYDGIVMSRDPMVENMLYEVKNYFGI